jgi:hypothetical protein
MGAATLRKDSETMGLFKKAVKEAAKLRMAISGPSGSGKTYTALSLATHLAKGKPIAVVDTENGSASKYADIFAFDVAEMNAPFHPEKFIAAIAEATEAGYGVVILDSISHAWAGTGGVLDIVDQAAKRSRSGNTYTAWKEGTPVQNKLIDAIVQSGVHIIVTMRSKTEYVLQDDGRGKQVPKKIGMAPVQRGEFEYEFDIVLDMDIDNNGVVSKTRCPALVNGVFPHPGAEMSSIVSAWLSDGAKPAEKPVTPVTPATNDHTNGNGHKPPTVETPADDVASWAANPKDVLFKGYTFRNPAEAKGWGMAMGVFNDEKHADNAYNEVKRDKSPKTPQEMWDAWINDIARRVNEKEAEAVTA